MPIYKHLIEADIYMDNTYVQSIRTYMFGGISIENEFLKSLDTNLEARNIVITNLTLEGQLNQYIRKK